MRASLAEVADRQPALQDAVQAVLGLSREIHARIVAPGGAAALAVVERRDPAQSLHGAAAAAGWRAGSAEYAWSAASASAAVSASGALASASASASGDTATCTFYATTAAASWATPDSAAATASSATYLATSGPAASRVMVATDRGGRREFGVRHTAPCPGAEPGAPAWTYAGCGCDRGHGGLRLRHGRAVAPHTGRTLDSHVLFEADLTTWALWWLGKFRMTLTVRAHWRPNGAFSLPSITLTRQAIRPADAPVFRLAASGDFAALVALFSARTASPHDRTDDGRTPLWVRAPSPSPSARVQS